VRKKAFSGKKDDARRERGREDDGSDRLVRLFFQKKMMPEKSE